MYAVHWRNSRKLRGENSLFLATIDFEIVANENVSLWKKLAQEKKREEKVVAWVHGTGAAKPTGRTSSALHIINILFTDHITIAIVTQTHTILSRVQLLPDLLSSVHDASSSNGSIKTFTKVASFWTHQPSFQPINHQPNVLRPQTK